jgi:benzaldehyde dehydrogenase (NAD)
MRLDAELWAKAVFSSGWKPVDGQITVVEPATGETLVRVGRAEAADVDSAARAAKDAQKAWSALPFLARADLFRKAATLLQSQFDSYADWIIRETGAIRPKAMFELVSVVNLLNEAASLSTQSTGIVLPADGYLSIARRVPHGVVGVISPFNFPFLLSTRAMAPALACGNAVLLKPDPRTPVSGGLLLAELLLAAGFPEGLLHVLPGEADIGEAVVTHPLVTMISFTGSTRAGRVVGELAGRHLKKVALELGGKNALIILEDADLDAAVSCGAWASWLHQGQICMSAGRHLVHRRVMDAYAKRMAEKAALLPVGDPFRENVAIGPLITQAQADRVRDIINGSVAMGAKLLAGGKVEGRFASPTVLGDVRPGMPAFEQEIFGPVVSLTSFESDDEAVALANATEYGLAAGVLTSSIDRGMAIAAQLNVGLVHVNDQPVNDDGFMPMGGRGASGNGSRHGGPANLDEFSQWQWTTIRSKPPAYPL